MKPFKYEVKVEANTQGEADQKMKSVLTLLKKLSTQELAKIEEVVNNPIQFAIVKAKLM